MSPRYIRYCRRCVLPESKPDLRLDMDGIRNACRYSERTPLEAKRRIGEAGVPVRH